MQFDPLQLAEDKSDARWVGQGRFEYMYMYEVGKVYLYCVYSDRGPGQHEQEGGGKGRQGGGREAAARWGPELSSFG